MKNLMTVLALGAAMGFAGVAVAKDAPVKPLKGKISKITPDSDNTSTDLFVSGGGKKKGDDVKIVVNSSTTITMDGKPAKVGDLKVGETVTITPATGTATTVAAVHPKKKKDTAAATPTPADGPSSDAK